MKPKKKYKSYTPVTIAISKEKMAELVIPPRNSLTAFKEKRADRTDWCNVTFRIKVGLSLAEKIYTEDTVKGMKEALDACESIRNRFMSINTVTATVEELIELEAGLDAVDAMQEENIRRHLLDAYLAAREYINKLVKLQTVGNRTISIIS